MEWKSHRVGGFCAATLTTAALVGLPLEVDKVLATAVILYSAELGSLLPDIDHPNSHISKKSKILSWLINSGLAISRFLTSILLFFCFWIPKGKKQQLLKGFEHRGIFHNPIMVVLLFYLLGLVPVDNFYYVQYALCAGYTSHLLMDMLTVSGVKLLFPFITYSFHLIPFVRLQTGNKVHEKIARWLFIVVTIMLLFLLNGRVFFL